MTEDQIAQIFVDIRDPAPGPVVRVATRADELPLLEMLRQMHAEPNGSGFRDWAGEPYPLDEDMVREAIHYVTSPTGGGCCGIIEGAGIEASVALVTASTWYSRKQYLSDVWIYVVPEHRGRQHYPTLVDFAKEVAVRMRLDLHLGTFSEGRTAAKDRLLARTLAGKKFGTRFMFQYNPASGEMGER